MKKLFFVLAVGAFASFAACNDTANQPESQRDSIPAVESAPPAPVEEAPAAPADSTAAPAPAETPAAQ